MNDVAKQALDAALEIAQLRSAERMIPVDLETVLIEAGAIYAFLLHGPSAPKKCTAQSGAVAVN